MHLLYECPEGVAIFKIQDKAVRSQDDIRTALSNNASVKKFTELKAFHEFQDQQEAFDVATALIQRDTPLPQSIVDFIRGNVKNGDTLAVGDAHLAQTLSKDFGVTAQYNDNHVAVMYAIRAALLELVEGVSQDSSRRMSLALGHSLGRHKLRCGKDKVDVMVIHAVNLLDDAAKEINTYAMRLKERYGWHFPELVEHCPDSELYGRVVMALGNRSNAISVSDKLDELLGDKAEAVVHSARTSVGPDVTEVDMDGNIHLAEQLVQLCDHRRHLEEFVSSRMRTIAPSLCPLIGEILGARLLAHAGSLANLAKQPASTIQLYGAEKALFHALKKKTSTPKYGVIYHASLVSNATTTKNKGRMARSLGAKLALAARVDSLGNDETKPIGDVARAQLDARAALLEGNLEHAAAATRRGRERMRKYAAGSASVYNKETDFVGIVDDTAAGTTRAPPAESEVVATAETAHEAKPAEDAKAQRKAEKAARKAEKEAKRAAKEERRRQKEAKRAAKEAKKAKKSKKQ